jgi:hypothetical protein
MMHGLLSASYLHAASNDRQRNMKNYLDAGNVLPCTGGRSMTSKDMDSDWLLDLFPLVIFTINYNHLK